MLSHPDIQSCSWGIPPCTAPCTVLSAHMHQQGSWSMLRMLLHLSPQASRLFAPGKRTPPSSYHKQSQEGVADCMHPQALRIRLYTRDIEKILISLKIKFMENPRKNDVLPNTPAEHCCMWHAGAPAHVTSAGLQHNSTQAPAPGSSSLDESCKSSQDSSCPGKPSACCLGQPITPIANPIFGVLGFCYELGFLGICYMMLVGRAVLVRTR